MKCRMYIVWFFTFLFSFTFYGQNKIVSYDYGQNKLACKKVQNALKTVKLYVRAKAMKRGLDISSIQVASNLLIDLSGISFYDPIFTFGSGNINIVEQDYLNWKRWYRAKKSSLFIRNDSIIFIGQKMRNVVSQVQMKFLRVKFLTLDVKELETYPDFIRTHFHRYRFYFETEKGDTVHFDKYSISSQLGLISIPLVRNKIYSFDLKKVCWNDEQYKWKDKLFFYKYVIFNLENCSKLTFNSIGFPEIKKRRFVNGFYSDDSYIVLDDNLYLVEGYD